MAVLEGTGGSVVAAGACKMHVNGRGWLVLVVTPWSMHIPELFPCDSSSSSAVLSRSPLLTQAS